MRLLCLNANRGMVMDESGEEKREQAREWYRRVIENYKPPPEPIPFAPVAHIALMQTPIIERLKATDAVILERLARGGGSTNWYHCPDENHLEAIEARLRPGSLVSFYFDDRIQ